MSEFSSYFLYQKYEQRGEQEAIPVYPNVYSIDADGTRERVVKIQDDPQCGYDPPVKPIYKWVNIPITQDYVCDDCPEYQTRWVRTDETICSGTPTPVSKKFVANYTGGITNEVDCNDNPTLTSEETKPSGYEASAMTSAVIGQCVTSIGVDALRNCYSLASVTIGSGVTSISYGAFWYCSGLTRVNSDVDGVCNIPDSVTSIGYGAFADCRSLTSVNIPNSLTRIGNAVFWSCRSLTSVTIPNSVTSIGSAFNWCTSLTSVTIPNSVTSIDGDAFSNCTSLTNITVNATTPPTLGTRVFDNTNDCPIYVPASSVSAYKTAENWSTYASRIQPIT